MCSSTEEREREREREDDVCIKNSIPVKEKETGRIRQTSLTSINVNKTYTLAQLAFSNGIQW